MNAIIRNLFKRKLSTSFAIVSFSIAFCCSILIYLFVTDELAFDKQNANFEKIYRLNVRAIDKSIVNCSFPGPFNDKLFTVSGVDEYARLMAYLGERYISVNNEPIIESSFLFGDPSIFNIFDFEFIAGNPNEALTTPFTIVITKSISEKYFKDSDALGKIIHYDNCDFTITGVVKDLPKQSHFSMNFLASISSYKTINNNLLTKWYMTAFNYYFLLNDGVSKLDVESQLADIFAEGHGITDKERKFEMYLEPLGDIHLRSVGTRWDNAIKGDYKVVIALIVIALLIFGISITNYVNNLTAEYRKKIRETGIRRINGASRIVLAFNQITETFFILFISLVISIVLVFLILPYGNDLVEKSMEINFSLFGFLLLLLIISTLISALYPTIFFNSFSPSDAVKNRINVLKLRGQKQQQVRGSFIIFQLGIATVLIVATIVVNNQLQLVLSTKVGFDKEHTLFVENPYGEGMNERYELFKSEILKIPLVEGVGVAQNIPGNPITNYSPSRLPEQDKKDNVNIGQITVDHDFLEVIGANFTVGRNFDHKLISNERNRIVINESAVKLFGFTDPIGKKIVGLNNANTPNGELEIIGVIEDMQYFSLREESKPVMYYLREWGHHNIIIHLGEGDYSLSLASIKRIWNDIAPEYPFNMQFMDEQISSNYKSEINTSKVISLLSGIAIFLSILGIFGMIVFTVQYRIKEIGIRKVNGARVSEILAMLNKDFVKWVVIAFVIATPIAWYAMHKWLENFAYKTTLSWWIFALAGVLVLGIALLTVSWQSWKAATRNPVEAVRYE